MGKYIRPLSDAVFTIASDDLWIESLAIQQLHTTANLPNMQRVVGMPDLHPGRGYPIGAALGPAGVERQDQTSYARQVHYVFAGTCLRTVATKSSTTQAATTRYSLRHDKAAAQFSNTRSRIMRPDSSSAVEKRP